MATGPEWAQTLRYKEKLQRQISRHSLFVVLICFFSFATTFALYITGQSLYRAYENNLWLAESFTATYDGYYDYITDDDMAQMMERYFEGAASEKAVIQQFYSFEGGMLIGGDILFFDAHGSSMFTTLNSADLAHIVVFDHIIHSHMLKNESREVYNAAYYLRGSSSRYAFARNIYDDAGSYLGSVSIYLDGDKWDSLLRTMQVDGVITDLSGSVIASSNRSLVDNFNRFKPDSPLTYRTENHQFWIREASDELRAVRFYSLVYDSTLPQYFALGLLTFGIIAVVVMLLARKLAVNIASLNTASMSALMSGIDEVREAGGDVRIRLESDDEFATIATHINGMLDSINALSERNLALAELNSVMEMKQLEAQFDPHFLYNTLEAIRYAIQIDPEGADAVIIKLTKLLRYSISGGEGLARLCGDIAFLRDYLDIVRFRFAERFSYEIEVAEECAELPVPKLLLQALVENSIKYGFHGKGRLLVVIRCTLENDALRMTVSDDGTGIGPERLEEIKKYMQSERGDGTHYGLHYIARRIALQYGPKGSVRIESEPGKGTCVEIMIDRESLGNGI
ncbi:MAG: histidine kinase [Clostridiaceae bacterium]|nr:histidine kinase [Eubacteriales bacterium]